MWWVTPQRDCAISTIPGGVFVVGLLYPLGLDGFLPSGLKWPVDSYCRLPQGNLKLKQEQSHWGHHPLVLLSLEASPSMTAVVMAMAVMLLSTWVLGTSPRGTTGLEGCICVQPKSTRVATSSALVRGVGSVVIHGGALHSFQSKWACRGLASGCCMLEYGFSRGTGQCGGLGDMTHTRSWLSSAVGH